MTVFFPMIAAGYLKKHLKGLFTFLFQSKTLLEIVNVIVQNVILRCKNALKHSLVVDRSWHVLIHDCCRTERKLL